MSRDIKSSAKTTETSIRIVNALRESGDSTIDELAECLSISESTVHRHIATLQKHNYIIKNGKEYTIGLQHLTLGGHARRRVEGYANIKEKVDTLACQTGERVQFIVEENGQRVYLYTEVGESAVPTGAKVGKRGALHTSAAGKAILAHLTKERVDEIIQKRGLEAGTEKSVSTPGELFDELERVQENGYAINNGETNNGVNAVGTPVMGGNDAVIGALSVAGPAHRLKGERLNAEVLDTLLAAANELELQIEHSA